MVLPFVQTVRTCQNRNSCPDMPRSHGPFVTVDTRRACFWELVIIKGLQAEELCKANRSERGSIGACSVPRRRGDASDDWRSFLEQHSALEQALQFSSLHSKDFHSCPWAELRIMAGVRSGKGDVLKACVKDCRVWVSWA